MVIIENEYGSCPTTVKLLKPQPITNKRNVKSEKVKVIGSQYVRETPKKY